MNGMLFSIALAAGCGLILLGRWTYQNPHQLFLRRSLARPPGRFLTAFARAFSTLLIFLGSYLISGAASQLLLSGYTVQLLSVPTAAAATWALRPRAAGNAGVAEPVSGAKVPLLTTRGKWLLAIILCFGLALALAALLFSRW